MGALFRGLMVPVSFVLYLAIFGAVAVAVVAAGPIVWQGVAPEELPTLLPTGAGAPSPWVIAAGLALVADLFIGMIAMLLSERATTVGRFIRGCVKTAFWFGVIFAGPLALYLSGQPGDGLVKWLPAILLLAGLLVAAFVTGVLLCKP